MYHDENPSGDFHLFGWKTDLGLAALPKDTFTLKGIRECTYGPLAEIFFPVYVKTVEIAYNINNSGATGYVRSLLGFSGLLVM